VLYENIHFNAAPFEAVEEYGVRQHALHKRLPHLQTFWRRHVAPATNRPFNTHLAAGVAEVATRIAWRSYDAAGVGRGAGAKERGVRRARSG
jgi:hypothetical protein